MIKYISTVLLALLLAAISYAQPLNVPERNWLMKEMGEPEVSASIIENGTLIIMIIMIYADGDPCKS